MFHTQTMKSFIIPPWNISEALIHVNHHYPYRVQDFAQSFSENQFAAKTWLVERLMIHEINKVIHKDIWILGGWYGTILVPLLYKRISNIRTIHLVDYDEEALKIAAYMFGDKINTHQYDVNFDMPKIKGDIIINTSCEHMYPMKEYDIEGLCVFQSNNFTEEQAHINCVESEDELIEQSGITSVDFKGSMPFHRFDDHYQRYMVIGRK